MKNYTVGEIKEKLFHLNEIIFNITPYMDDCHCGRKSLEEIEKLAKKTRRTLEILVNRISKNYTKFYDINKD